MAARIISLSLQDISVALFGCNTHEAYTNHYFTFLVAPTAAQDYKIIKEVPTSDVLCSDSDDMRRIYYRCYKDKMYSARKIGSTKNGYDLKLCLFDLNSGSLLADDTIAGLPKNIFIKELAFNDKYLLIVSYSKYVLFDLAHRDSMYQYPKDLGSKDKTEGFKECELLNDSLALLYAIYDHHPSDGYSGLEMHVLNMRTRQFQESLSIPFRGIALSHMSTSWLTVVNQKIYVITPLSGMLQVFDTQLNMVAETSLTVFDSINLKRNIWYENRLDGIVGDERKRINKIRATIPKDSTYFYKYKVMPYLYSKGFMSTTIDTVRNYHPFVENIFRVDDSLMGVTIAKPEYGLKYRDLLVVDPNRRNVVRKYVKIKCAIDSDTLAKPEDFYPLCISWGKAARPYFHNHYVYSGTVYPMSLYQNGSYKKLSKAIAENKDKNAFKWTILKYQLE